jgi:hypothetical protein
MANYYFRWRSDRLMDNKQPTQEQIKEFWEYFGVHIHEWGEDYGMLGEVTCKKCGKSNLLYLDDVGHEWTYLPEIPYLIDLNNLFKYAVPKLPNNVAVSLVKHGDRLDYYCRIQGFYAEDKAIVKANPDPALALFWAIWEVIHA